MNKKSCASKKYSSGTRDKNRIIIFDTSLRDGEQSPGASMTVKEKVILAKQLKKLGVDVIEAGFPIASNGDFDAVYQIANKVKGVTICALARCCSQDIIAAGNALKNAEYSRIHVFIATSDIHMQHKLEMTREQVITKLEKSIMQAKQYTNDVEFSAEDATRSDIEFLVEVYTKAIAAGATTINIPDTVGYSTPSEYAELVRVIKAQVVGVENVVISVHCHNDLGLATANSLAALKEGARQIECTVNGIGERSGNCALEEVVMGLKTRFDHYHQVTNINTKEIVNISQLVTKITGMMVQPNKAIVGENAFSHEAGIHQHGVLKHRQTYEIMSAEDVGFEKNKMIIGKHSGQHAIAEWLLQQDIKLNKDEVSCLSKSIKNIADTKKLICDEDIHQCILQLQQGSLNKPEIASSISSKLTSKSQQVVGN